MTLLLLAAGQAADEPMYTKSRNHSVPFNIAPGRRAEFSELRLFVSSDKGKNWRQEASLKPESEAFVFRAPEDGEYWLCVAPVDRQGRQQPENIYQIPDARIRKMVIDTRRPTVDLVSAQRKGEDVVVSWAITEEHPDAKTLKLEYQVQGGPSVWTQVPVEPKPADKRTFRPSSPGPVTVRMSFQDLAGNVATATAEVPGAAGISTAGFAQNPPSVNPPPVVSPPPVAPVPPPPSVAGDTRSTPPPVTDPPYRSAPPSVPEPVPQPTGGGYSPPSPDQRPIPATEMRQATHTIATGQKPLPPAQHVNNPRVTLEYELSKVGPSGVGSVDLWWTSDDGKTWQRAPTPPGPDEQKERFHQRSVDLQEGDGIYGFALVVRSRAGLSKQPPKSGDVPEIRIELDTTAPQAQLFKLKPDALHQDAVLLSWVARDKNLTPNPISIDWSATSQGPWQTIAADQPNSGQFSWALPPSGMPVQVYLRLRVRDMAGNEGIFVSTEPQLVDLTEPEGRLVNVSVLPRTRGEK
jgi:hypothetical protein